MTFGVKVLATHIRITTYPNPDIVFIPKVGDGLEGGANSNQNLVYFMDIINITCVHVASYTFTSGFGTPPLTALKQ